MTATPDDLLAVLRSCIGRENGAHVDELAAFLGCTPRDVRHLVTTLRMDGHPVCGEPETGYFLPLTAEEALPTLRFLRARSMRSLVLLRRMRRAVAELAGQKRLPT